MDAQLAQVAAQINHASNLAMLHDHAFIVILIALGMIEGIICFWVGYFAGRERGR